MNHTKYLLKIVTIAFAVLASAVIVYLIFKPSPTPQNQGNGSTTSTDTSSALKALQEQTVTGEGFSYQKPQGWAKLSKELLDSSAAASGIGMLPSSGNSKLPVATFTIKIASATPKDANDLKNSVTTELKKLAKFKQTSNTTATVAGVSGQRFTYTFGDKDKTKQELTVLVHDKKTYFLLTSAAEAAYEGYAEAFTTIVNSFTFK